MLFRHKWESNELALLRRDLGHWTVDSVDIFYKFLGIATAVYCKGKGYLRGKVFFIVKTRQQAGRVLQLWQRDTCRLTVPHTTPWHGHHGPHHPFPDNVDPWPTAVRECLNQCADEHLHYCRREQEPTNHPGWRDALVHLFHTTGMRDPRLRLVRPTRAKQDAHTGPRVTPDGRHLHVGGYRRRGGPSPPKRGAAYHPPAALMYILRDVLAESEHQEPNADVAWPEPLRPRPHAPTPLWLVTTDDQCAQATGQAQLRAEWVIVQVGAGQPKPRGLPRGTALLVATGMPHDPHMAVHAL